MAAYPLLRRGSSQRTYVLIAQRKLQIKPDGLFGPNTEAAVKRFQTAHGLKADGIIGPKTWAALLSTTKTEVKKPQTSGLKPGSSGDTVKLVQKRLKEMHINAGAVDGVYGQKTAAAVKAYQRSKGLPATGNVNTTTWASMWPKPTKQTPKKVASTVASIKASIKKRPKPGWSMTQAQRKQVYGHKPSEVKHNLVTIHWLRKNVSFTFHEIHAEQMRRALKRIDDYETAKGVNYKIRKVATYCWRPIRGGTSLSNHSFGIAIDFNWDKNPMGKKLVTDMPSYFVNAFKAEGARWGGDYKGRKDAMHFEF